MKKDDDSIQEGFDIDSIHMVSWKGKQVRAEILMKRRVGRNLEYYVHYIGADRRHDEWVPESAVGPTILEETEETASEDFEGRQKRQPRTSIGQLEAKQEELEKERVELTKVKSIEHVRFGNTDLTCWYFSPYPEEFRDLSRLYVCDKCLKYVKSAEVYHRHRTQCKATIPGTVVYESGDVRIYEVDGKTQKLYCQCLCLFGKLFLDHKTVYYDIESFLFYVLVRVEGEGRYERELICGFFSKEKESYEGYNLACIIVFPHQQKRGYGRLLIELSYEISKRVGKPGTPERPLSDLGAVSFKAYWESAILEYLLARTDDTISFQEMSLATGLRHGDIIHTLYDMGLLQYTKAASSDTFVITTQMIQSFLQKHPKVKPQRLIDDEGVLWEPPGTLE